MVDQRERAAMLGTQPLGRRWLAILLVAAVVAAVLFSVGCAGSSGQDSDGADQERANLRVLFAGSLIIPFEQLEREFEAAHPGIDVNMEGHGSIQAVRIVSDLHEQADLIVTADYRLIPMLLYRARDPDSEAPYANWSVIFATNRMTLAYTADSAFAGEVNTDNWADIIDRPGVRLGSSDPRLDANGYRALMTVKLAEEMCGRPELFAETYGGAFRIPIRTIATEEGTVITVPEVLETKGGSHIVLRPYSVNLLPLLKSGDVDYAFEYESVAKQHGLEYVSLPREIDLGDPALAAAYATVTVRLDFQRFASVKPEFTGEPIRYGATIPSNAREPAAAAALLAFLLGPEGQRIMAENHQPMITPAPCDNLDALPEPIKILCTSGD